jgi:hypothetical protein
MMHPLAQLTAAAFEFSASIGQLIGVSSLKIFSGLHYLPHSLVLFSILYLIQ